MDFRKISNADIFELRFGTRFAYEGTVIVSLHNRLQRLENIGDNSVIRSLLIFGYIIAVLLISGLARANESKHQTAQLTLAGTVTDEHFTGTN